MTTVSTPFPSPLLGTGKAPREGKNNNAERMITRRPTMHSLLPVLLLLFSFSVSGQQLKYPATFTPADNFLLDCGATSAVKTTDGRNFKTDSQSASLLSSQEEIRVSVPSAPGVPSPLYLSARIFTQDASYTFHLSHPGWHWIRLHFFPVADSTYNLTHAVFSVKTDDYVLLHSFNQESPARWDLKEYIINATSDRLSIHFVPQRNSMAYINAIEVVSAPGIVISETVSSRLSEVPDSKLSSFAYQTAHRVNVGGDEIPSGNDTLGRTWVTDDAFLKLKSTAERVSASSIVINYPEGTSPLVAPNQVYASAVRMANEEKFNVTWGFDVDPSFSYIVRLHFCDIISKALNELYFNVYLNQRMAIPGLDLSAATGQLGSAYYADFFMNSSVTTDRITVQIGMVDGGGSKQGLLNGVEIFKMSNSVGSLDGEFGVDGRKAAGSGGGRLHGVVILGFVLMVGAFVGLVAVVVKWHKRPQDWQRRNSFSSWLLPIHAGHSSFMTSKGGSAFGSHKSGFTFTSTLGLGRYFSLAELQEATKNFDDKAVIGVGGFGNVYLGELDDGTKVAVKRGNPQSEQGINEFQTEIQMLSKLRHRHLVSLIGYCDENSEMILVYEYMANGPFRDHLYGKDDLMPLTWKQRLEICIGAARGLHYLHTGTAQGIIHRDVKTTNILLDDNFIAKVSDFGLSKDAPGMDQTHVSTAVKGSFGYLDPEYFRSQRLNDKSDVYSFGVVLLETLCARPALNPALPREQVNLAEWAMKNKRKDTLQNIIDPLLEGTVNPESMNKLVEAAEKCLAEFGSDRPSMGDVLWNLEYALQLQDANPPAEAPPAHARKPSSEHKGNAGANEEDGQEGQLPAMGEMKGR